jgi:probable phosphoglycerate mutase
LAQNNEKNYIRSFLIKQMTEKTIYIIRHGETEYNKLNIVQGSGIDADLNEEGKRQAELFYKAYRHIPFDSIMISALKRTHQSVAGFIKSGIPFTQLDSLNEISWGRMEGMPQSETQKAQYWQLIEQWNAGNLNEKIPDGESPIEMQHRQQAAVHHILNENSGKTILICMHGRAMKSFLCLLTNTPLTQMESFKHSNLCLYQLTYANGVFKIQQHNNTQHLIV